MKPPMSMNDRDVRKDLQPDAVDGLITVAKTALGGLGLIGGGTIAELLGASVAAPLSRRRDEWLIYLAEGYEKLKAHAEGIDWQQSLNDPAFVSLVVEACQIAVRNHRVEKLRALRNAVLNAAVGIDIEEDVRFAFLALIDTFTASHLNVLSFAYYPFGWMLRNGVEVPPKTRTWSARQFCLRRYQEDPQFLEMVVSDLQSARLIETHPFTGIDNTMSPSRLSLDYTSSLGGRFYRFFSTPDCIDGGAEQNPEREEHE